MTKRNLKSILIILLIINVFVWLPSRTKKKGSRAKKLNQTEFKQNSLKNDVIFLIAKENQNTRNSNSRFSRWGRDPFFMKVPKHEKPLLEPVSQVTNGPLSPDELSLKGIFIDDRHSSVLIHGHILNEGDLIEGYLIKKIHTDKVIISDGIEEFVLRVRAF